MSTRGRFDGRSEAPAAEEVPAWPLSPVDAILLESREDGRDPGRFETVSGVDTLIEAGAGELTIKLPCVWLGSWANGVSRAGSV